MKEREALKGLLLVSLGFCFGCGYWLVVELAPIIIAVLFEHEGYSQADSLIIGYTFSTYLLLSAAIFTKMYFFFFVEDEP